jgi:hypothetical protein
VVAFDEQGSSLVDREFALLEPANESQFLLFEFTEDPQRPQGTLLTRILLCLEKPRCLP